MNAERLLAVYDQISDAPDAITRLRRFILDLAVRGKLVEQSPSDEPASQLLERIEDRKAEILTRTGMRKPRNVADMDPAETWADLPTNWTWTQISNLGLVSPRNEADDDSEASFVPMPMIFAEYGVANGHEVRHWGEIKKGYTHFAEGDVGLAKITPCFENGKSTVFRNLTGGFGSGTTELHILRPILVDPDYVVLFLKSPQFIETGIPKMTGTAGQKRVSSEYFTSSPFPLPPLAEQHRIVAKVDELMGLCDRLEEARKTREETRDRLTAASLARLTVPDTTPEDFPAHAGFALDALPALTRRPDQIKHLRQTILNLAVRGKLVEQDPADEPASQTLKKLKVAAKQAFKDEGLRARKPVKRLERNDLGFAFPKAWELPIFDDVFVMVSGVTKGGRVSPEDSLVRPYLRVANVQRGYLDLNIIKTIEVKSTDAVRFLLNDGDIVMTEGGDWDKLGRAAIWRCEVQACIHQNHVFRVRPPSEDILAEWVITYINSELGRSFFENASKQTTNLASINMTQLRGCPLPLPPLAEQHRIVARVDALMALCDRLEAALTTADATRARLLEAVLHEALQPRSEYVEAAE